MPARLSLHLDQQILFVDIYGQLTYDQMEEIAACGYLYISRVDRPINVIVSMQHVSSFNYLSAELLHLKLPKHPAPNNEWVIFLSLNPIYNVAINLLDKVIPNIQLVTFGSVTQAVQFLRQQGYNHPFTMEELRAKVDYETGTWSEEVRHIYNTF